MPLASLEALWLAPAPAQQAGLSKHAALSRRSFDRQNASLAVAMARGIEATLLCVHGPIPGIEYTDMMSHTDDAIYTLRIRALPRNNETTIQCTAVIIDQSPQFSPVVTFLIQGLLGGVSNLERNTSTLSWMPPFSLNLTDVDPDIVYCVEVYNITCVRRDLIISDCNVTEPSYTSEYMAPNRIIYEYTVTPRSNVEGASNGTSVTVTEEFLTLKSFQKNRVSMMGGSEVILTIHATIHDERALTENQIHTKSYTMSSISLDGQNDDETKHLISDMDIINMSLVIFRVPLPFRRLWNYTVLARGCDEHPLTNSTLLSTHDMQDISIASPSAGTIWITGNFIQDSPAIGIVVAILITSNISFYLLRREGNQVDNQGVLSNISRGQHIVTIFVVDSTGLPFNRAATIPQNVMVNGSINQSFPIEYEVKSTSTGVCITCTFLDSSTTGCVAVVHQQISQLNTSGLMNIESSHKFNRSGETAYGCIEGIDVSRHQVGVIGGFRKQPSTKPSPDSCSALCQALVVIVVTLSLTLSVIVILISVYIGRKRQKVRLLQQTAIHIDVLESDSRYETVHLKIQSGHMRAEMDTNSTAALHKVSSERPHLDSAPSLPPPRSMDTDPVYTEAVTVSGSRKVTQIPATEGVVYDDIKAFQNKDGQQYAIIGNLKTGGNFIDDPNRTVYSEIQHAHSSQQVQITNTSSQTRNTTQLTQDNDPTPKPVTLEHLLPELLPLASKWQSLGEALSLDEDQLDEIFTNNETDEACLEVMLEQYMARPYLNHSWEEIQKALKQIGEELTIDQPEVPPMGKTETIHPELPSGEDLMGQQHTLDEEIASQKSESEEGVPKEDSPQHTEPQDNKDTCDTSQQGSNLCDNQLEDMDKDDYPSSFDEQENEPSENSNQDDGQFESGKVTSPASETASITSDNRNVHDANKSELHQRNIYAPLPFHTECEEQINKEFCDVLAPRSGTCSWSDGVDGASELVISSNWNFLHYCLHSKDT